MRYLALWRPTSGEEGGTPDPEHLQQMRRLVEESMKRGALIATEPLAMRAHGARVRLKDGAYTVLEEDQRMAGYAFLEASSRAEAVEFVKSFMAVAGEGECEIRQILEFAPSPA